jgi:hypothetical protein
MNLHQMAKARRKRLRGNAGIAAGRHGFLREEIAVHVGDTDSDKSRAKVCYKDGATIVQAKKRWTSAAGQPADGSMDDPSLANQLFGDERNGASLKAGHAGKISAGNGLTAADEVENNAAIDVAGRLTRSDLSVCEVDTPHLVGASN